MIKPWKPALHWGNSLALTVLQSFSAGNRKIFYIAMNGKNRAARKKKPMKSSKTRARRVCPFTGGKCVRCALYRGRHYNLCFTGHLQDTNDLKKSKKDKIRVGEKSEKYAAWISIYDLPSTSNAAGIIHNSVPSAGSHQRFQWEPLSMPESFNEPGFLWFPVKWLSIRSGSPHS